MKVESNKYIKDFWNYLKSERDMERIKPRIYWQLYWINANQITRMSIQWRRLYKVLVFLLFQIKIDNQFYYFIKMLWKFFVNLWEKKISFPVANCNASSSLSLNWGRIKRLAICYFGYKKQVFPKSSFQIINLEGRRMFQLLTKWIP